MPAITYAALLPNSSHPERNVPMNPVYNTPIGDFSGLLTELTLYQLAKVITSVRNSYTAFQLTVIVDSI